MTGDLHGLRVAGSLLVGDDDVDPGDLGQQLRHLGELLLEVLAERVRDLGMTPSDNNVHVVLLAVGDRVWSGRADPRDLRHHLRSSIAGLFPRP